MYGKEANVEHGPAPSYAFQENAPWFASHVSAMGLSNRTGSGSPLHPCRSVAQLVCGWAKDCIQGTHRGGAGA